MPESALEGEITDHLGHDKHNPAGRGTGNSRDGTRAETVFTDVGPVEIDVPRDRDASFEPKIVAKRQKRLGEVDEMVISLPLLKNRGIADVLLVVCDGLTGLPDAITTVWSQTITQTCIVQLLRNSFRYVGRQHWDAIAKALKPVCPAATEAVRERFVNARIRSAVKARGHFPNEQAALKCVYPWRS